MESKGTNLPGARREMIDSIAAVRSDAATAFAAEAVARVHAETLGRSSEGSGHDAFNRATEDEFDVEPLERRTLLDFERPATDAGESGRTRDEVPTERIQRDGASERSVARRRHPAAHPRLGEEVDELRLAVGVRQFEMRPGRGEPVQRDHRALDRSTLEGDVSAKARSALESHDDF